VFDRSVDLRVTRVRRKVEVDPSRPQVIRTVHGTGYIFVPPEARQRGAAAR
jgi:DNA-binding response OmpR family regulator